MKQASADCCKSYQSRVVQKKIGLSWATLSQIGIDSVGRGCFYDFLPAAKSIFYSLDKTSLSGTVLATA